MKLTLRGLSRAVREAASIAREVRSQVAAVQDAAAIVEDVLGQAASLGSRVEGLTTRLDPSPPASARRAPASPRVRRPPSERRREGPIIDIPPEDIEIIEPAPRGGRR